MEDKTSKEIEKQVEDFLGNIISPLIKVKIVKLVERELNNAKHNGYLQAMQDMANKGWLKDLAHECGCQQTA